MVNILPKLQRSGCVVIRKAFSDQRARTTDVGDGRTLTTVPQEVMAQSPLFSADVYSPGCTGTSVKMSRSRVHSATFGQMLNQWFV